MQKLKSLAKRGANNPRSKLTEFKVANLLKISQQDGLKRGWQKRWAVRHGVSKNAVTEILHGKKWKYLSDRMRMQGLIK